MSLSFFHFLLCNWRTLPVYPIHSSLRQSFQSLWFKSRVDCHTCIIKAKLVLLFHYDARTGHSLFVHKQPLYKEAVCVRALSSKGQWALKANCQRGKLLPSCLGWQHPTTAWRITKRNKEPADLKQENEQSAVAAFTIAAFCGIWSMRSV